MILSRSLLLPLFRSFCIRNPYREIVANPTLFFSEQYKISIDILTEPCRTLASRRRLTSSSDLNNTDITSKSRLISKLNFKCEEDARPFTKLPLKTLQHIYKVTKNDEKNGYCTNRLYFIAERIQCSPSVLSGCLAQRIFIYSLSFDWLASSLKVVLEMGIPSDRLLRDFWVLKYHHATIRERLERIKNLGIDKLYPWMVRCSEDILQRFISITRETKDILGDTQSTHTYLAARLNISQGTVHEMCIKIPALRTIRVTKVKSFLDFLENEGFHVEDIANKPRILTASQKTVKQRLDKLRKLGLQEINLNALCKSRKGFKKYCESMESVVKSVVLLLTIHNNIKK